VTAEQEYAVGRQSKIHFPGHHGVFHGAVDDSCSDSHEPWIPIKLSLTVDESFHRCVAACILRGLCCSAVGTPHYRRDWQFDWQIEQKIELN
jgi:hypothetical protein